LAIVGLPPFSLFVSEFAILGAAFSQERYLIVTAVLLALVIGFGALVFQLQQMLSGESPVAKPSLITVSEIAAMAICSVAVIGLGVYLPHAVINIIHNAMAVLTS
jgi:hydrogenase-4 component F